MMLFPDSLKLSWCIDLFWPIVVKVALCEFRALAWNLALVLKYCHLANKLGLASWRMTHDRERAYPT